MNHDPTTNIPLAKPLTLMGAPGSPYTRKMLAVLRYRRLPYRFLTGSHNNLLADGSQDLPAPKVKLLPTFYLPDSDGNLEAVVDSTPIIRRLETSHEGRSVIPNNSALAFINYLLEDYADEWLTKAMFHYRWYHQDDIDRAASILPRWGLASAAEEDVRKMSGFIAKRQIDRLYVVGSSAATAELIEDSYKRYLSLMCAHLESHPFLLGGRPSSADFAAYGQLTQLTHFDPTPMRIALEQAPRVFAWVDLVDDLSGMEPADDQWSPVDDLPDTLHALLCEVGRVYVPVLLANAAALVNGEDQVQTEIDSRPWTQPPFAYQSKCLQWIRKEYAALDEPARTSVDTMLAGTGCETLLAESPPS